MPRYLFIGTTNRVQDQLLFLPFMRVGLNNNITEPPIKFRTSRLYPLNNIITQPSTVSAHLHNGKCLFSHNPPHLFNLFCNEFPENPVDGRACIEIPKSSNPLFI